jgi:hypothetical protein
LISATAYLTKGSPLQRKPLFVELGILLLGYDHDRAAKETQNELVEVSLPSRFI